MLYGSVGRVGLRSSVAPFSPAQLFAAGEQGAWYDPSDFSTMFQDAAGTTPVTAVEQPVGRILDKSGRGNHATQSTPTACPVLSARVNLLTRTEEFDNAAWTKAAATVTANATTDPLGGSTADAIIEDTTTAIHYVAQTASYVTGTSYTHSVYAKSSSRVLQIALSSTSSVFGVSGAYANFDLTNGVVSASSGVTTSIENAGGGWYKCSVTATAAATVSASFVFALQNSTTAPRIASYLGNGVSLIYLWGADLRVSNAGVNLPAYQRVVTATDYDTTGFPMYLRFDGTDDGMATGTINPGSVDKAQVFAGVRKLSDSALGEIIGLTADPGTTSGAVALVASSATGDASRRTYGASLLGTTGGASNVAIASVGLVASPNTNIVTALLDTAASGTNNQVAMRLNGVAGNYANNGQTASTGNLANAPLYIGRRAGTSFPFNGHLYSLIVRFSATNLPAATIAQTETWVNGKTYAYGPVTPNPLIWGSGNTLIWGSGNNITWGNS